MTATRERYVLAIDLGTSGPKVGWFDLFGRPAGYSFAPTTVQLFPGGGAEQRPQEWWDSICTAVRDLWNRHPIPKEAITAVCCTAQWSGTVAVDRDGQPLTDAIIWMDSRGAPYAHRITAGIPSVSGFGVTKLLTWLRLTGGAPGHHGKDSIAHILYLQAERPEIYAQTYKFLEPKDYLNLRLTGQFAASYDSITLHWLTDNRDLTRVDYNDHLLSLAGIDREKLPDLRAAADILGPITPQAAAELGLPEGVPVVMGTPDVQSAAVGSGGVQDYAAHLYIGTSAWLACHVPFMKADVLHNIASLPSAIPDRYLVSNEQQTAGACLNYLRDNLIFPKDELDHAPPEDVYELFNTMAMRVPPGSGNLIFTPWLYGERTPMDDRHVRSGFFNQSLYTTRAHMIRAVFEGVAYNARWLLHYVEKFVGRRLDPISIVGGGAQSDLWCQIHADVLDRTILQMQDPIQANTRGAANLAAVALGAMKFADIAQHAPVANTYRPNPKYRKIYDRLFKEFVNLYNSNRRIHRRLNREAAHGLREQPLTISE